MILADAAVGSRELVHGIRQLGCDAETVAGLSTDFQFDGTYETGHCLIGIERKAIEDLLQSMRDNRLGGGQVGRAIDCYDHYYLIVEGPWRRGEGGMLEIGWPWHQPRGNFRYAEVSHFLNRLRVMGGVNVWRTYDVDETIATLVDLHNEWQQPWSERLGKRVIYAPAPIPPREGKGFFQPAATPVQKWLYQLPGMGDKKTFELAPRFTHPGQLVELGPAAWEDLPGVGPTGAKKIFDWIHHGKV